MAHAPFSPSAAHRWTRCAGSLLAPPSPESAYSKRGTALHEVAARCLQQGRAPSDKDMWVGITDAEYSDETVDLLTVYVSHVNAVCLVEDGALRVESRVYFGFTVPPKHEFDCWGTADALIWTRTKLVIIDLKTGSGVNVDAIDNEQLELYALAALDSNPTLAQDVVDVELHIVQPTTSREPKVWALPRHELEARRDKFKRAMVVGRGVLANKEARPEHYVPGDHCGFCGKAPTCDALRAHALVASQGMFEAVDVPPVLPAPVNMTPEQLRMVLDREGVLVDWLKLVRDEAGNRIARGLEVPGYKLVGRLGNRKWKNETEAAQTLAVYTDPYERSIKSPATIERELGRSGKEVVATLTERPTLSPVLARADDPRPAVTVADFPRITGGQG